MKKKVAIMLIGKTHTGKTTFAKELKKDLKDLLILEADPIAVLMNTEFPELRFADDKEHTGEFKDISLKFRTFLLFLEFALSLEKPIILANSNMWKKGRALVFDLCKKNGYKVVGVYLDFPESTITERINKSNRSINVLRTSKDFNELIVNQRHRMQPPDPSSFEEFFHCINVEDLEKVREKLIKDYSY